MSVHRRLLRSLGSLVLAASLASCSDSGESFTQSYVLADIALIDSPNPDGTTTGVDLDGRIDDEPDPETCWKTDFVSPEGVEGIDNQLSLFGGTFQLFGGDLGALIQGAINEGSLLILVELEGLDDYENDSRVTVRLHFGEGPTDVGNDGRLVPGQSFDIQPGTVSAEMVGVLRDGRLEAGTFDAVIPVAVLDQRFELPIEDGRLQLDLDPNTGEAHGLLAGAVPVEILITDLLYEIPGPDEELLSFASTILRRNADMYPDEDNSCSHLSAAMLVRGVPAFVLPQVED